MDNGFIGQIGVNGAYLEESVDVPYIGNYVFYIPYLTGPTPVQLIIDTNGQNTGEVYKIPQSQPEWQANILEVQANLNKGSNLIKFYTNNNEKGPWIGPVIVSKIFYYYPVYPGNVTLTGSSNNDSGIIVYSGFGVGGISFTVTNVPKTSQYNLLINYSSPVLSNNVYIYVNGQYIGQPQSFSTTNSINSIAYKIIPINLNQGSNTITIS
ncbi:hypothetical protein Z962_10000 [Clostridium botulinum C/D str. BKT12695]|nr:hypothetical protein Z962_10000 [Clostridium botulinum C/D str. BKT12695]